MLKITRIYYFIIGYYKDESGYWRTKEGKLIHRKIAYKKIYLRNPEHYPLLFSKYIVHHLDKDKENNRKNNLRLDTQEGHTTAFHPEYFRKKK